MLSYLISDNTIFIVGVGVEHDYQSEKHLSWDIADGVLPLWLDEDIEKSTIFKNHQFLVGWDEVL